MKLLKLIFILLIIVLIYYLYTKINIKEDDTNYLLEVVACEMPASFEDDAIKAQIVAARTYLKYVQDIEKREITTSDQCRITEEDMKDKWQVDFETYKNKILNLIKETENEIILKENKLLKTYYFSTSNGYTIDSNLIFKEDNIKGVESSFDKYSTQYERKVEYTKEELINILGNFNEIKINEIDNTNHVVNIYIDNNLMSGIEFRKKLNLRSTDFKIETNNNIYSFTTHGYGHGVGMSQYGANYLAKNNYNYQDILKYYYGDIKIKKY